MLGRKGWSIPHLGDEQIDGMLVAPSGGIDEVADESGPDDGAVLGFGAGDSGLEVGEPAKEDRDALWDGCRFVGKIVYLGAPAWVADSVLNPRTANGLLSFCYWWDGARWYRGESPATDEVSPALPGVWTTGDTVEVIASLVGEHHVRAIAELVEAAEARTATRSLLARALGEDKLKADSAYYQLLLAGAVNDPATQED